MRSLVVVGLLALPALSSWACSCHDETVVPHRALTATGTWQVGDVMSSVPEATYAEPNAVVIGNRGAPMGPPFGPFDLRIRGLFILRDASGQTPILEPIPRVAFQLTVHGVLPGPAEIDLDDSRGTLLAGDDVSPVFTTDSLEPFQGLSGHLSVTDLPEICAHGLLCTNARAAVSFSATAPGDRRIAITSATFTVHDTSQEKDVACQRLSAVSNAGRAGAGRRGDRSIGRAVRWRA